jgi:hypothetical protein
MADFRLLYVRKLANIVAIFAFHIKIQLRSSFSFSLLGLASETGRNQIN